MRELEAPLRRGLTALGLDLSDAQVQMLLEYLVLLAKWGRVYNLTARLEPAEMLTHHLLDSLSIVMPLRRQCPGRTLRVLDVGAGAEGEEGEDPDAIAAKTAQTNAQRAANSAELNQAKKKLETTKPYIELNSTNGIRFLLGKVLDQAFNTRTIDAFSKDMMTALNVKTKSDVSSFITDHLQPFSTDKNLGKSIDELIKKMTAEAIPDPETEATSSDESLG